MDSGLSYQALLNQSELQADHVLFTGLTVDQLIYATSGGSLASASTGSGLTFSAGTLSVNPSYIRGLISESDSNLTYNATTGVFDFADSPVFTGLTVGALNGILKASSGVVSGSSTTSDLPEGSNLYYTDSRARSAISAGTGISYNSGTGVITNTVDDTDDLKEGSTNLYFTNARARAAFSAGTGISYDSGTGVITNSGSLSATGTANQVLVNGTSGSAQTGAITLTLPQSIATSSNVQFTRLGLNTSPSYAYHAADSPGEAYDSVGKIIVSRVAKVDTKTTAMISDITGTARVGTTSNHNFALMSNNTEQVYLTTAGSLGVGTSGPSDKLHVSAGNVEGIRIESTNCGALKFYTTAAGANNRNWMVCQNYHAEGDFGIIASSAAGGAPTANTNLYINRSGQVGIGTTSPTANLQIGTMLTMVPNWPTIGFNANLLAGSYLTTNPASYIQQTLLGSGDRLGFMTFASGTAGAGLSGGERISILNSNGNVGINQASPSERLHIVGRLRIDSAGAGDTSAVAHFRNNAGNNNYLYTNNSNNWVLTDGNVGIGQTAPTSKLHVNGNAYIYNESSTTSSLDVNNGINSRLHADGVAGRGFVGTSTNHIFTIRNNNTDRIMLSGSTILFNSYTTNGTVTTTGGNGTITVVSDARLKENIEYIPDGSLEKILQLKPCSYKLKNATDSSIYEGFIAQELEEHLPRAVDGKKHHYQFMRDSDGNIVLDEDGKPTYNYDEIRPRGVSDIAIIAHLVKAVQELTAQVNSLKSRIEILEG